MYYLGIDIGKNTHVASLIDENGKLIFKGFSFSNSISGLEGLLQKLEDKESVALEIGMEATGHYWLCLYAHLLEKGFVVHVINPIQTDGWRKGTEIRKRKTDVIDSVLIAELIRFGDYLETTLTNEDSLSLRNLARFRNYLCHSVSDLKRKTLAVLDQVFPEYTEHFSDVFGKASSEILLELQTPDDFLSVSPEQLESILTSVRQKEGTKRKLTSLSESAANSFGICLCADSFSLQIRLLIEQIKFIQAQIADLESEITRILDKLQSPITTIPGIGNVNAAVILGEIRDIKRFSNPAKLVAYAGIDATVSQSGNYRSSHANVSKRGSPYLRSALYMAAFQASLHDPTFKAFYDKKRSEGKHHNVAVIACARKLCNVIHAVLTQNVSYQVQS